MYKAMGSIMSGGREKGTDSSMSGMTFVPQFTRKYKYSEQIAVIQTPQEQRFPPALFPVVTPELGPCLA